MKKKKKPKKHSKKIRWLTKMANRKPKALFSGAQNGRLFKGYNPRIGHVSYISVQLNIRTRKKV